MKLWYDRKSKDPTYFIQHGIRNGKKTTTKNIFRIGRHSELLAAGHDDPLAYAKEFTKKYNDDFKADKIELSLSVDLSEKVKNFGSASSLSTLRNIGYFYIKSIYDQLGMRDFFSSVSEDRKVTFDLNAINEYLTVMRILHPGSKLDNFNHMDQFYGFQKIEYQHIHRFMKLLADHYDSYIDTLFENSCKIIRRDTSVCYFDCTNFYFEKETEDDDVIDEVTGEVIKGFLKYGVSKEHRPNPIVQMGLFMDKDGIPLSMCMNSGSDNENLCAVPAEEKLLKMFKNKDIIYCSDAGLGYTNTRLFNNAGGRKFVVTQSVKKLSDVLQTAVFNDSDYRYLRDDSPASLGFMQSFDKCAEENRRYYNERICKVIDADRLVDIGLEEFKVLKNGTAKKVKSKGLLKQRVIVTYCRKMAEYQKKVRERQLKRAEEYVRTHDMEDFKKNSNDFRRFIKKVKGEKGSYIVDRTVVENEAKYDGFYAIATNIYDRSVKDILSISEKRYRIEDCFRVMKTNFEGRPVYHYREDKIKAHFLTCFTALLIYRLIEVKLDRAGHHFTVSQILETLKNMNVVSIEDAYYQSAYTGSDCLSALEELFSLKLDRKYYLAKDLNKFI